MFWLALGQILPLPLAATAGLFLVAVAPGAPLVTKGDAKFARRQEKADAS